MNNLTILQALAKIADEETFPSKVYESTPEHPKPFLLIDLGKDTQGRQRIYKVEAKVQEFGEKLLEKSEEENLAFILEFECELPIKLKEHALFDVSSLLHFINRTIALPGFQFDEVEEKAYFRHVLFTTKKGMEKRIITSILGLSLLFIDLYTNPIELVGSGQKTFIDILEEMIRVGKEELDIS